MHTFLTAFVLQAASTIAAASQVAFQDPSLQVAVPSYWNSTCPHGLSHNEDDELYCPLTDYELSYSPSRLRALEEALNKTGPWTSKPYCIAQSLAVEAGEPEPEPLCLFNDNTFAANRGISFITTPTLVRGILNSEAYTDPSLITGANVESNPPFYLTPMQGRGIGAVVNRTLHKGDRIFSYTPVLVLNRDAFTTIDREDQYAIQNEAVRRLPEPSRDVFMALHGHFGDDKVHDIIRTNSFQIYFGDHEEGHNVVLPETSRFNHDCRPNAHYYFDNKTLQHHVHALRTIHSGEELTVSYIDGAQPRVIRLTAIERSWGFACSCSACSQPTQFSDESDRRIMMINKFRDHLNDYSNTSIASPEMAETLVSLYEQERLIATLGIGYTFAALTHNAFGNVDRAYMYAALAIEHTMLNAGPDVFDALTMMELVDDPKAHWSYKMRLKNPKDEDD